ncbi:MAG: flavodoxin domain-containing protein [Bacillota bacterium]|nr:flavodoxin domain-containing protein [Bacillota bacterium]
MKNVIIYTTKYGSVENAAKLLKEHLAGEALLVNIMNENPPGLEKFDNVMIGGSIYAGRIQKKLSKFVVKNLPQLLTKRVGLFVCAGEKEQSVREKELVNAFPKELFEHAVVKEIFGYEIHYGKLNFWEKKLVSSILGHKEGCSLLSQEKIRSFAKEILES